MVSNGGLVLSLLCEIIIVLLSPVGAPPSLGELSLSHRRTWDTLDRRCVGLLLDMTTSVHHHQELLFLLIQCKRRCSIGRGPDAQG